MLFPSMSQKKFYRIWPRATSGLRHLWQVQQNFLRSAAVVEVVEHSKPFWSVQRVSPHLQPSFIFAIKVVTLTVGELHLGG